MVLIVHLLFEIKWVLKSSDCSFPKSLNLVYLYCTLEMLKIFVHTNLIPTCDKTVVVLSKD